MAWTWAFEAEGLQLVDAFAIARIEWSRAKRELAAVRAPTFNVVATDNISGEGGQVAVALEQLRSLPPEEATAALLDIVVEEIARGAPPAVQGS
jgi:hypothetical protein